MMKKPDCGCFPYAAKWLKWCPAHKAEHDAIHAQAQIDRNREIVCSVVRLNDKVVA